MDVHVKQELDEGKHLVKLVVLVFGVIGQCYLKHRLNTGTGNAGFCTKILFLIRDVRDGPLGVKIVYL